MKNDIIVEHTRCGLRTPDFTLAQIESSKV